MKTAELTGAALDWAVTKCEGFDHEVTSSEWGMWGWATDWAQGGPLIDRIKGFQFKQWLESHPESCCEAHIHNYEGDWIQFGPTTLIAAMRCYVASKLGDEVDVPKELQP